MAAAGAVAALGLTSAGAPAEGGEGLGEPAGAVVGGLGPVAPGPWGAGASVVAGAVAVAAAGGVKGDEIAVGAASGGGRSCGAPVPCDRVNIQAPYPVIATSTMRPP